MRMILPRQWVLVQFRGIRHSKGNSSDVGCGNGKFDLIVMMVGIGVNTIVDAGVFNSGTCGRLVTLQNELEKATEGVVAV